MIKLDDNLLAELGLAGLPAEEKKKMLAYIYETLEMRVGVELAKQMSEAQLSEFEQFIKQNDEAGALRWLETNFPHYKDVVAAEFEKLKIEVRSLAPQILAGMTTNVQGQMPADPVNTATPQAPTPSQPPAYQQPYPEQSQNQPQYNGVTGMPTATSPAPQPQQPYPQQPQYPYQQPYPQQSQPQYPQPPQQQPPYQQY